MACELTVTSLITKNLTRLVAFASYWSIATGLEHSTRPFWR